MYLPGTQTLLSEEQLVNQLNYVVKESRFEDDLPVGVLTSEDRNVWAQGFKRLTRGNCFYYDLEKLIFDKVFFTNFTIFLMQTFLSDPDNKANVDEIIKSICLICLDQPVNVPDRDAAKYEVLEGSMGLQQMLHGGGTSVNSMNRWFDKICQVCILLLNSINVSIEIPRKGI